MCAACVFPLHSVRCLPGLLERGKELAHRPTMTLLVLMFVGGMVCDDGFSQVEAQTVCKQLGYPQTVQAHVFDGPFFGAMPDGIMWLDDVQCSTSDVSLENCRHAGWGMHNCVPAAEAVSMQCGGKLPGVCILVLMWLRVWHGCMGGCMGACHACVRVGAPIACKVIVQALKLTKFYPATRRHGTTCAWTQSRATRSVAQKRSELEWSGCVCACC